MKLVGKNWLFILGSMVLLGSLILFQDKALVVRAQDQPTQDQGTQISTQAIADPSSISADVLNKHIADLQVLYANQIDAYRAAERQYKLALTQYQQLQTLSSLEKAVTSANSANQARVGALISYFEFLHARMVAAPGMSLADKQALSPQIIGFIELLKAHRLQAVAVTSQPEVNQLADEFKPILKQANTLSARVLFLLDIAQINAHAQTAQNLFFQVKSKQEELPLSQVQRAERNRAYSQIESLLTQIGDLVSEQSQIVLNVDAQFSSDQRQPAEALNKMEANLIQVLNYSRELANIL